MMLWAVLLYLAVTVAIGVVASRFIKGPQDYILAGRRLPLAVSAAALFATWFGSETVLGASTEMAESGLPGVIEDPFGAALCLFLIGALFARRLYRMDILTFGDFYRMRYGRAVELIASICLILSYLGWIAAQMVAIGIVLNVLSGMPTEAGILLGSVIIVLYTGIGGMWAVSLTDFFQMIFIIVGLALTLWQLTEVKPIAEVVSDAPDGFYNMLPENGTVNWLNYFAAWITIGLGSIPQQDVFQRVMSARSMKVSVRASYLASFMYLTVAAIPLLLGLYTRSLGIDMPEDKEMLLPNLIMAYCTPVVKVLFFGALLSAVMSTASGALLAPASIVSENIINHFFKDLDEKQLLWWSRLAVVIVASISIILALSGASIYDLVGQSSALSLVSLFVPMVLGLYWRKANTGSALGAIVLGMTGWLLAELIDTEIAPLLYGLGASIAGTFIGQRIEKRAGESKLPFDTLDQDSGRSNRY